MKITQNKDLQAKLDTLIRSKSEADNLIAEILIIKHAKKLGLSYVENYIDKIQNKDTDFLLKVKKKFKGFKIIDYI